MNWKELSIEIDNQALEAVSNIMHELGSGGVVIENNGNRARVTGYYYNDEGFPSLLERIKYRINKLTDYDLDPGELIFTIQERKNEEWATNWHKYFKPMKIGKNFIITPSWESIVDEERIIIRIDPGMAFGIGSHETTRMCIELLEEQIDKNLQGKNMLDIGAGTGILSIAAAYLGLDNILGIDIDPAAVEAARDNIRINQVTDRVKILKGDMTKDIRGKFSIITANLLPDLIMLLLPSLPSFMKEDTKVILSGIIMDKREFIIDRIHDLGLGIIAEKVLNEWVSFVVSRE